MLQKCVIFIVDLLIPLSYLCPLIILAEAVKKLVIYFVDSIFTISIPSFVILIMTLSKHKFFFMIQNVPGLK